MLHEKLFAHDFDVATLTVTGTPFLVANQVAVNAGTPALSVSREGTIVYRGGSAATLQRLVWVNRTGTEIGAVGDADAENPSYLSISSDGRFIAMQRKTQNMDIWLLEVAGNVLRKLTFDPSTHNSPLLSPDGRSMIYGSNRAGDYDLYQESLTGPASVEKIVANSENNSSTDWSRDGRLVLFDRVRTKTGKDIWLLPRDGDRKPFAVMEKDKDQRLAQFSPTDASNGSLTNRTKLDDSRSTSSRSPAPEEDSRFPPMAVLKCTGARMARSSFIWSRTAG